MGGRPVVYTVPRAHSDVQRLTLKSRPDVRYPKLLLAMQVMESNIKDPLTPDEMAEVVGLSPRQLERLFAKYLAISPNCHSLRIRLEKGLNLLRQTSLSVTAVYVACGFKSLLPFSKCYRATYSIPSVPDAKDGKVLWSNRA